MSLQPSRRSTSEIITQMRPRGLVASIRMALLQPILFFRTLSAPQPDSRQWLWMAILLLLVAGIVAIRQEEIRAGSTTPPIDGGGGGIPGGIPGGDPTIPPPDGGASPATTTDPAQNLTTALIGGAGLVVGWGVIMVLLTIVSLARGLPPVLGLNLQIAIWASTPLLLMGVGQLLWYGNGGTIGAAGISGLLPEAIQGFNDWPPFARDFVYSLFSHLTFFWLWGLALIYLGARYALRGSRVAAVFVVAIWFLLSILVPIASGVSKAPLPPLPQPISLPETPGTPPAEGELPPVEGTPESTPEATVAP